MISMSGEDEPASSCKRSRSRVLDAAVGSVVSDDFQEAMSSGVMVLFSLFAPPFIFIVVG